jgi:hypothetical protein
MSDTTHGVCRDWTEDASHENGRYECQCVQCGQCFVGHKRRVVCRACANPTPTTQHAIWGVWIPVDERLPDEGVRVLTVDVADGPDSDIGYVDDDVWHWEPDLRMSTPPTHWMPLPQSPHNAWVVSSTPDPL